MRIRIIGGSGYTGVELLTLQHGCGMTHACPEWVPPAAYGLPETTGLLQAALLP